MTIRPLLCALALAAATTAAAQPSHDPFAPVPNPPEDPTQSFDLVRRLPRMTAELVLGSASALGMAYGGYQLGCALSSDPSGTICGPNGGYGAIAGFALGIPIGVMLGGTLIDGDGAVLATVFGTGLGMAAALGASYFLRDVVPPVNPLPLLLIPLGFAVAGYEITSHDSRAAAQAAARGKHLALRVTPMATFTPGGAALGLIVLLP